MVFVEPIIIVNRGTTVLSAITFNFAFYTHIAISLLCLEALLKIILRKFYQNCRQLALNIIIYPNLETLKNIFSSGNMKNLLGPKIISSNLLCSGALCYHAKYTCPVNGLVVFDEYDSTNV
jgi:hypothetical protein